MAVTLRLDYRPPLDWRRLLDFVGARAVPGVEAVEGDVYRRTVRLDGLTGAVAVAPDPDRPALRVTASPSLLPRITELAARLRAQLDLDARPDVVDGHLAQDPLLAPRVAARPGLRVPGAFDAHEVAIRAVLGQQVSVRGATTLAARLVAAFGEPLDGATPPLGRLFPGAARLAGARVEEVRGLGMPEARARTIVELSRALAEGRVDLSAGADPERAVAALLALPGVGPWTAQYLAMRALRWPDAFPAGDLGVRRALGLDAVRDVEARARGWSPWRAYAVMHLWCE